MYGNEAEVGEAVRASGIDRAEIFVTSKLNNGFHRPEQVATAFEGTLDALDLGYVDLFLIHWPLPTIDVDYVETWKAMERLLDGGAVRAIGVSNFQIAHLERLLDETTVVPAVNQIEIHPYLVQDELRAFDRAHGIATEAWSPIAQGRVLDDPTITAIAADVGRTAAQVVLALARPARRHRLPEVRDTVAGRGELRHLRFRAERRAGRGDHRARSRTSGTGRTRTRSTTSPADGHSLTPAGLVLTPAARADTGLSAATPAGLVLTAAGRNAGGRSHREPCALFTHRWMIARDHCSPIPAVLQLLLIREAPKKSRASSRRRADHDFDHRLSGCRPPDPFGGGGGGGGAR